MSLDTGNPLQSSYLIQVNSTDRKHLRQANAFVPFATLDKDLSLAARAEGVIVLGQN